MRNVFAFWRLVAIAAILSAWLPTNSRAQGSPPLAPTSPAAVASRDAAGAPAIRAFRLPAALKLDGVLDESFYADIEPARELIQQDPDPGAPATERTDVWVFFDDGAIYVGARLWMSHPEHVLANDLRRDAPNFRSLGDSFSIAFDTFHDRRNGYIFGVSPLGGMFDALVTNERDNNRDWNGIWDVRVSRFEAGWAAEFRIPLKTLRYAGAGTQTWGFNVCRVVDSKNEAAYFTPIPPSLGTGQGFLKFSSAVPLVGLELPPTSRLVEIKPYGISSVRTDRTARPAISNELDGDFGVDAKVGVTSGLTADFTYNTDFAQVEEDEQQINLTRFSLFFPEKREFFLEGAGIFSFGGYGLRRSSPPGDLPLLFFSRRIGLQDGRAVPLTGGARVTGKAAAYSIGAVNIQSGDEPVTAARATNFTVLRVKRDVLRRSSIGALLTHRSVSLSGPGTNTAYGADGVFSFFQNLYINTYVARTVTPGRSGDDLSYRAQLDYNADRYGLQVERLAVGRNFNPEAGYARRVDFGRNYILGRFSPRPAAGRAVRQLTFEGSYDALANSAARLETRQVQATFRTAFQTGDDVSVQLSDNYEFVPDSFRIFRDVTVPSGVYRFRNVHVEYEMASQRNPFGAIVFERGTFYDGHRTTLALQTPARAKFSGAFSVEPVFSVNWIDLPQGRFTAAVAAVRPIYAFSPRTLASALVQYNSGTSTVSTNARFRWEFRPGSELFLVYSDARDTRTSGLPDVTSRSFIVKITRLFQM